MHYRHLLFIAAATAPITLAYEVAAADLGPYGKAPPPPPAAEPLQAYAGAVRAPIWSGLYLGLSGGYGWGSSEQTYDRNDNHGLATTSPEGFLGALTLGYNVRVGSGFLVGLEGDIGLMDISADDKIVYDGHNYRTQLGPWWGTVRARAGFTWDRVLFYGTGGVAFAGVNEVSIGNTAGETAENRDVRAGWVVGGGIEYALTDRISTKIEYLHMDFGTYRGYSPNVEDFTFKNTADIVRVGLSYRF